MPGTTTIIALFWEDYGWIGPLTEQETRDVTATLILHNRYITPHATTLTESDTSHHIMFKRICHRAGYLATDPRIQPLYEAPEEDLGVPDEHREQRKEARRANNERRSLAQASIAWIQAIPTLLGLRELNLHASNRKVRRHQWASVCEQIRSRMVADSIPQTQQGKIGMRSQERYLLRHTSTRKNISCDIQPKLI
jgi:hypothetical protein